MTSSVVAPSPVPEEPAVSIASALTSSSPPSFSPPLAQGGSDSIWSASAFSHLPGASKLPAPFVYPPPAYPRTPTTPFASPGTSSYKPTTDSALPRPTPQSAFTPLYEFALSSATKPASVHLADSTRRSSYVLVVWAPTQAAKCSCDTLLPAFRQTAFFPNPARLHAGEASLLPTHVYVFCPHRIFLLYSEPHTMAIELRCSR